MLDEVHERTQLTDVLMGLMKKILKKRKNLKLIISSATVDADNLCKFFNLKNKKDEKNTAVAITVKGSSYPVDIFYLNGK